MKKKIIIISVIALIILIPIILLYIDGVKSEKKFMNTWNNIEKEFNKLNDILIKFDEDNNKLHRVLYIHNNEIISMIDSKTKVEMNKEEKEMFIELLKYYKNELAAEGDSLDYIYIFDDSIIYRTESGYFGLIYSKDGKEKKFRKDFDVHHIKDNWYFQTVRHSKMFK